MTVRRYGAAPYSIAVLHGGPGAGGEMAPVARELAGVSGVLEPFQNAISISGQILELHDILETNGNPPIGVIGWSWGAWLGYLYAAAYPMMIRKLIIVGSGPFDQEYAVGIMRTRLGRLAEDERREIESIQRRLRDPRSVDKDKLLLRFGSLLSKVDSYDPVEDATAEAAVSFNVYRNVWKEAESLRSSGRLLELGKRIRCPVVAVHGDYDPHPYQGVKRPLEKTLRDFHFILLENCGHTPWIERNARDRFFVILKNELS